MYVQIEGVRGQNKFHNTGVVWKQGEIESRLVQNRTG